MTTHRKLLFAVTVLVVLGVTAGSLVRPSAATANELVNVTLQIPAQVYPNPCTPGDIVTVRGTLHIVYYVRSDGQGGFHVTQLVDEKGTGWSALTGMTYRASDRYSHSFYAGAPFPVTDTLTHDTVLASRGSAQNFLMTYEIHTTVNALGVPTATVENVRLSCNG
ncbi:MAG: hypothetical protein M3322_01270 [Actinomycetota bacterium]|nr:hypothetical protein [Actinomycetota bacterium]